MNAETSAHSGSNRPPQNRASSARGDSSAEAIDSVDESNGRMLYAVAAGLSGVLLLASFSGPFQRYFVLVFLANVLLMVTLRAWMIPVFLALFLTFLLTSEVPMHRTQQAYYPLIYCTSIFFFLLSCSRLYLLSAPIAAVARPREQKRSWRNWRTWFEKPATPRGFEPRQPSHFTYAEIATGIVRVILPITLALTILLMVPFNRDAVSMFRITPGGFRVISLAILLFFTLLLANILIMSFAWRHLSPPEARIYLRCETLRWLYPDLLMILRQKRKKKRKSGKTPPTVPFSRPAVMESSGDAR